LLLLQQAKEVDLVERRPDEYEAAGVRHRKHDLLDLGKPAELGVRRAVEHERLGRCRAPVEVKHR
jgi:hypothetical protein